MIGHLRQLYPEAHLVCMVGPMINDYYPHGVKSLTVMHSYMDELRRRLRARGEQRVSFLEVSEEEDIYGEDWHPTRMTHQTTLREREALWGRDTFAA